MFRDSHEDSTRESLTSSTRIWHWSFSLKKECSLIWIVTLLLILWHNFQLYRLCEWSLLRLIWRIWCSVLAPLLQMNRLPSSLQFRIHILSKPLRNNLDQISIKRAHEPAIQIRISCIPSISLNCLFILFLIRVY